MCPGCGLCFLDYGFVVNQVILVAGCCPFPGFRGGAVRFSFFLAALAARSLFCFLFFWFSLSLINSYLSKKKILLLQILPLQILLLKISNFKILNFVIIVNIIAIKKNFKN